MTPLERRAVLPFYLKMMGLNAIENVDGLWDELVATARTVTLDEVKWLLSVGAWRPVVMGAWYGLRHSADEIGLDLRRAMASSQGSLTAPPLAAACVAVLGSAAVDEMSTYVLLDPGRDGAAQVVGAGIRSLGLKTPVAITESDERSFGQLLDAATRLRATMA